MIYRAEPWDDSPRTPRGTTKPEGLCLHATGASIVVRALEKGRDPNAYAADYYDTPGHAFPHDLVTLKSEDLPGLQVGGTIYVCPDVVSIAPWWVRSHAQGLGAAAVQIYQHDDWDAYVRNREEGYLDAGEALDRYRWWRERWPQLWTPLHLFPGNDPNRALLSMEMVVPVEPKKRGGYRRLPFTPRQHDVAAWRAAQMVREFSWPVTELLRRIVGHEDVHPIARTARSGPWDPGAGRFWDWVRFFDCLGNYLQTARGIFDPPKEPDRGPGQHD